eukprot:11618532-Alexandrium_andersonii.AAC.1
MKASDVYCPRCGKALPATAAAQRDASAPPAASRLPSSSASRPVGADPGSEGPRGRERFPQRRRGSR